MKNHRENFKKEVEGIKLTDTEKSELFHNFKMMMDENPLPQPIQSNFIPKFSNVRRYTYAGISAFLLAGIGTSYAAEFTAPGNFLYPVKTIVNDTAISATAFTSEAKVEAKIKLVGRRVDEIKDLIEKEEIDIKEIDYINEKIEKYNDDVSEEITESVEENNTQEKDRHAESLIKFETVLNEHKALVQSVEKKRNNRKNSFSNKEKSDEKHDLTSTTLTLKLEETTSSNEIRIAGDNNIATETQIELIAEEDEEVKEEAEENEEILEHLKNITNELEKTEVELKTILNKDIEI